MISILEELLLDFENNTLDSDSGKIKDLYNKPIFLYGAGNIGKKLYSNLKESQLKIIGFIDRNKELYKEISGVKVYLPEAKELEKFKDEAIVILSGLFSLNVINDIKTKLASLGFKKVLGLHEINFTAINRQAFYENLFDGSYNKRDVLGKDRSKIINACNLLERDEDKKLYIDYIKAHLTMDFTRFDQPNDVTRQYLADDIEGIKDYSRFIDCGGFDGDTIRNLISNNIKIKEVAIFEPQNNLCRQIADYLKENKEIDSVKIFPCGVYSEFAKLRFSTSEDAPSTGKVNATGNDIIQCVAIDDVLQGFNPTFIKMDIEGAELDALKGCKDTIIKSKPQLAICVYHSLSDIWEIPLLIKSYYSGYKFYLRNYNFMGLETVLYAFPDK